MEKEPDDERRNNHRREDVVDMKEWRETETLTGRSGRTERDDI